MRLLNAKTLKLHEFFDSEIPPYAILSHRWQNEEVTFKDLCDGRTVEMAGWAKIVGCCRQAVADGISYNWIDTCCIDKSSSAELSEAINSMYRWYQNSTACYAFLSDVPSAYEDPRKPDSNFSRSKWFTRGWTLQELLAPRGLVFYNEEWTEIGTKSSLKSILQTITGIKVEHLFNLQDASVAQKMSWAAPRTTTRIEDRAYSLMGIFQVNMPPLYGEGMRAFIRLQEEIIRTCDDASIFAWEDESFFDTGLLADSPAAFWSSGDIIPSSFSIGFESPFLMTNRGLQIKVNCLALDQPDLISVPLACDLNGQPLAVKLRRYVHLGIEHFCRCNRQSLHTMAEQYRLAHGKMEAGFETRTIYIKQASPFFRPARPFGIVPLDFEVNIQSLVDHGFNLVQRSSYFAEYPEEQKLPQWKLGSVSKAVNVGNLVTLERFRSGSQILLLFQKGGERISLQICVMGQTLGVNIVVTETHLQDAVERIASVHFKPQQLDKDRVCQPLRSGYISATLKIAPLDAQKYREKQGRELIYSNKVAKVQVTISENPPKWFHPDASSTLRDGENNRRNNQNQSTENLASKGSQNPRRTSKRRRTNNVRDNYNNEQRRK